MFPSTQARALKAQLTFCVAPTDLDLPPATVGKDHAPRIFFRLHWLRGEQIPGAASWQAKNQQPELPIPIVRVANRESESAGLLPALMVAIPNLAFAPGFLAARNFPGFAPSS